MPSSDQPDTLPEQAAGGTVRYRVRHTNFYSYGNEIALAHHLLHLSPRSVERQRVVAFHMSVNPAPSALAEHVDVFGNPTTYLEMQEPHARLTVGTEFEAEIEDAGPTPADFQMPWEQIRDRLAWPATEDERAASAFVFASPMIESAPELRDYALSSFTPGRAIGAATLDLTERIHREFTFDPTATEIATPIADVLTSRRGVCQDFAHLEIGCLRAIGLAARYISGYLRTVPPPGQPRAIGADVSHAWLALWCGGAWLDFDPTNGRPGSSDLITLAWGRDYSDVSPTRGVVLGSAIQSLAVSVDVETLADSGPVADGAKAQVS
jgi:transglutaminase-like putative cysteine protease